MTKEHALALVANRNRFLDKFYRYIVPAAMEAQGHPIRNGTMSAQDWLRAQQFIAESPVYEDSKHLMQMLREEGFDVKINMQDYRLTLAE